MQSCPQPVGGRGEADASAQDQTRGECQFDTEITRPSLRSTGARGSHLGCRIAALARVRFGHGYQLGTERNFRKRRCFGMGRYGDRPAADGDGDRCAQRLILAHQREQLQLQACPEPHLRKRCGQSRLGAPRLLGQGHSAAHRGGIRLAERGRHERASFRHPSAQPDAATVSTPNWTPSPTPARRVLRAGVPRF
jgi:hypothetical protein